MPRVKKDPSIPLFDFMKNPDKDLKPTTLQGYKKHLNKITELTYLAHLNDASKPIISNKSDLMNNADYVVKVIQEHTDKRLVLCGLYSAVFYSIGRQNLDEDERAKPYVSGFQKSYYTDAYKQKLIDEGKLKEV